MGSISMGLNMIDHEIYWNGAETWCKGFTTLLEDMINNVVPWTHQGYFPDHGA